MSQILAICWNITTLLRNVNFSIIFKIPRQAFIASSEFKFFVFSSTTHVSFGLWHVYQVRIYTADGISAELEKSKLEYLQASIVVTSTRRLMVPKLLLWNMPNFANDKDLLVEWVCNQLPTSGSLRKSMVECPRGPNNGRISNASIEIMPYEFEFQYLLASIPWECACFVYQSCYSFLCIVEAFGDIYWGHGSFLREGGYLNVEQ